MNRAAIADGADLRKLMVKLGLLTLPVVGLVLSAAAFAADSIKIGLIDPLSGPFANIGQSNLKHYQAAVERVNRHGGALGVKFEIVAFDNKSSPQEALINLQAAIDQGIRFVTQASGSNIAHALIEGINRHNERNPSRTVLYLNHGAVDPALTNEKCSFWHFRFDANGAMKLEALTDAIAGDQSVRSAYLLNQDYAWGHSVSRDAKEMLARKRPELRIAGDDLHPLGKVKDFAPYVSKIIESGADAVVTGNWGNDLALLIRAAKGAGLKAQFYTMYASLQGTPSAMGEAGADRVKTVITWHPNIENNQLEDFAGAYREKYKEDWGWLPSYVAVHMLAGAIEAARNTDPVKVAKALEGLSYLSPTGPALMRKDDHQLIQPLYLATFTKTGAPGVKHDAEGTGFGWRTDALIEPDRTALPTTCRMQRPDKQ
jgi:branched-chain amino acid transport system substrate-binding protein